MKALTQWKSSVARRFDTAFVGAAAIPLILLAAVAYYLVADKLQERALDDAHYLAKDLGMAVFDRLKFVNDELLILSRHVDATSNYRGMLHGLDLQERTHGLLHISHDEKLSGNVHLSDRERSTLLRQVGRFSDDKPLLITLGEPANRRLFMLLPQVGGQQDARWFGAELDTTYLWDTSGIAARPDYVCILDNEASPVFCNAPDIGGWVENSRDHVSERRRPAAISDADGETFLTAAWTLFLKPHYQFERWTVLVGIPRSMALSSIANFDRVFAGIGAIGVLLALGMGRRLIRSNLKPLKSLSAATDKLAEGNFRYRVSLDSGDEFERLGDAFNDMAAQIGQQFDELQALASFDRALQSAQSIEGAMRAGQQTIDALIGPGRVALLCHERWSGAGILWCLPFSPADVHELALAHGQELVANVRSGDAGEMVQACPYLQHLGMQSSDDVRQFPMLGNEHVAAEIVLRNVQPGDEEATNRIVDVLGIALDNLVLERRLFFQANHDWLSKLPNRARMRDLFNGAVADSSGNGSVIGMLLIDLDRFKQVNDSLGHGVGDRLLALIGDRLRSVLPPELVLSRFAGDEFVAMLPHADSREVVSELNAIADQINSELDKPFGLGLRDVRMTATMGAAVYPYDGGSFESMLQSLNAAAYAAKSSRRGSMLFFSSGMRDSLVGRMDLEQALKGAVPNNELVLHYQPVMDARTRRVRSAEALMRWERPGVGLVFPGGFIDVAEDSGLIADMGNWALHTVCRQMQAWIDAGYAIESVAVNVSSIQLSNDEFVGQVQRALDESGLRPQALTLEVTETALIGQFEEAVERLKRIRSLGVRIMIDDFGTGYASLKYLKMLPIDGVKIDRLFVKDLPDSAADEAIVAAVVSLAQSSGFKLVAEGIETEAQAHYLRDAGVPYLQGFLFDKGLAADDIERRLRKDLLEKENNVTSVSMG